MKKKLSLDDLFRLAERKAEMHVHALPVKPVRLTGTERVDSVWLI